MQIYSSWTYQTSDIFLCSNKSLELVSSQKFLSLKNVTNTSSSLCKRSGQPMYSGVISAFTYSILVSSAYRVVKESELLVSYHPLSVYGFSIHLYYLEFYLEHKIFLSPLLNCSLVCDYTRHITWFLPGISFL